MREAFCCECGRKGSWPLCSTCKAEKKSEDKVKGEKEDSEENRREHHSGYFEAIIQNRAGLKVAKLIRTKARKMQRGRTFSAWQKEKDFYFSDYKVAKSIARSLSNGLNLNKTESREHVGFDRREGKKQYKWSICLRNKD